MPVFSENLNLDTREFEKAAEMVAVDLGYINGPLLNWHVDQKNVDNIKKLHSIIQQYNQLSEFLTALIEIFKLIQQHKESNLEVDRQTWETINKLVEYFETDTYTLKQALTFSRSRLVPNLDEVPAGLIHHTTAIQSICNTGDILNLLRDIKQVVEYSASHKEDKSEVTQQKLMVYEKGLEEYGKSLTSLKIAIDYIFTANKGLTLDSSNVFKLFAEAHGKFDRMISIIGYLIELNNSGIAIDKEIIDDVNQCMRYYFEVRQSDFEKIHRQMETSTNKLNDLVEFFVTSPSDTSRDREAESEIQSSVSNVTAYNTNLSRMDNLIKAHYEKLKKMFEEEQEKKERYEENRKKSLEESLPGQRPPISEKDAATNKRLLFNINKENLIKHFKQDNSIIEDGRIKFNSEFKIKNQKLLKKLNDKAKELVSSIETLVWNENTTDQAEAELSNKSKQVELINQQFKALELIQAYENKQTILDLKLNLIKEWRLDFTLPTRKHQELKQLNEELEKLLNQQPDMNPEKLTDKISEVSSKAIELDQAIAESTKDYLSRRKEEYLREQKSRLNRMIEKLLSTLRSIHNEAKDSTNPEIQMIVADLLTLKKTIIDYRDITLDSIVSFDEFEKEQRALYVNIDGRQKGTLCNGVLDLNNRYQNNKILEELINEYRVMRGTSEELSDFEDESLNKLVAYIVLASKVSISFSFLKRKAEILKIILEVNKDTSIDPKAKEKVIDTELSSSQSLFGNKRSTDIEEEEITLVKEINPKLANRLNAANQILMLESFVSAQDKAMEKMDSTHNQAKNKSSRLKDVANELIQHYTYEIVTKTMTEQMRNTSNSLARYSDNIVEITFLLASMVNNPNLTNEAVTALMDNKNALVTNQQLAEQTQIRNNEQKEHAKDLTPPYTHAEIEAKRNFIFRYLNRESKRDYSKVSYNYFRNALIDIMQQGVQGVFIGVFQGIRELSKATDPTDPTDLTQQALPDAYIGMDYKVEDLKPGVTEPEIIRRNNYLSTLEACAADVVSEEFAPKVDQEMKALSRKTKILGYFFTKYQNKVQVHKSNKNTLGLLTQAYNTRIGGISTLLNLTKQKNDPIGVKIQEWIDLCVDSKATWSIRDTLSPVTQSILKPNMKQENLLPIDNSTKKIIVAELGAYAYYLSQLIGASSGKFNTELQKNLDELLLKLNQQLQIFEAKHPEISSDKQYDDAYNLINIKEGIRHILSRLEYEYNKAVEQSRLDNINRGGLINFSAAGILKNLFTSNTAMNVNSSNTEPGNYEPMEVPEESYHLSKGVQRNVELPPIYADINRSQCLASSVYVKELPQSVQDDEHKLIQTVKDTLYSALLLGVDFPLVITRSDPKMMEIAYQICMVNGISFLLPKEGTPEHDGYTKALDKVNPPYVREEERNYIPSKSQCDKQLRRFTDQILTYIEVKPTRSIYKIKKLAVPDKTLENNRRINAVKAVIDYNPASAPAPISPPQARV